MINRFRNKSSRAFVTGLGALSLAAVVLSIGAKADGRPSSDPNGAVAAARGFLGEVDDHRWEAVWNVTTPRLQKFEGTESGFIALMKKSRRSLYGKCLDRRLASDVLFKTDPEPGFKGEYAYLYFDASFEGVPTPQREFVIMTKDRDGTWKNDGWACDDRARMPLSKFLPK